METSKDYRAGWTDCAQVIEVAFTIALRKINDPIMQATIDQLKKYVVDTSKKPPMFLR